jgi:rifampicin phosphotransferase
LPAVVGCTHANSVLPDGARVIVDGTAGQAEVVA